MRVTQSCVLFLNACGRYEGTVVACNVYARADRVAGTLPQPVEVAGALRFT
jgi:hypothetical protein